ncbi:FAD binding domain-containing protein [Siccirubricoccus phaeus]|uniref:FAD binding domain-containing protein n=1 Tax=Siccirubricoccus phaeus TaxID=2595053 RepID=UPI0011F27CE9|nr:FAD binding domain-containing protein [Siccirubricoccus phaeus]
MSGDRKPASLAEALSLLAGAPEAPLLLAGGTDVYPARAVAEAWGRYAPRPVLDLSGLGLAGIEDRGDHHRIGAGVTWAALRDAPLPPWFDGLRQAARQVGGVQVQARGTVLGNLCNASPAADGVPPLLTLEAEVELASRRGTRRLPLGAFILGNRRTALAPDEIATAILVPKPAGETRSAFLKLGARSYLVISIAMVAGLLEIDSGRIAAARLAIGACSPVAQRLPELEAALIGARPEEAAALAAPEHLAPLSPIDDVRATAEYRRHAALVLLRRLLAGLAAPQAQGGSQAA